MLSGRRRNVAGIIASATRPRAVEPTVVTGGRAFPSLLLLVAGCPVADVCGEGCGLPCRSRISPSHTPDSRDVGILYPLSAMLGADVVVTYGKSIISCNDVHCGCCCRTKALIVMFSVSVRWHDGYRFPTAPRAMTKSTLCSWDALWIKFTVFSRSAP